MVNRILITVAAAGGALAVVATAGSSPTLTGPGTIRVTDRLVKHIHVDGGEHGRGAGDLDFYRAPLQPWHHTVADRPLGHHVHEHRHGLGELHRHLLPAEGEAHRRRR